LPVGIAVSGCSGAPSARLPCQQVSGACVHAGPPHGTAGLPRIQGTDTTLHRGSLHRTAGAGSSWTRRRTGRSVRGRDRHRAGLTERNPGRPNREDRRRRPDRTGDGECRGSGTRDLIDIRPPRHDTSGPDRSGAPRAYGPPATRSEAPPQTDRIAYGGNLRRARRPWRALPYPSPRRQAVRHGARRRRRPRRTPGSTPTISTRSSPIRAR